jgi:hypothetical protein
MSQCISSKPDFPSPGIPGVDRPEWIERNGKGIMAERYIADVMTNIGFAVKKMADRRADLAVDGKIEIKRDRIAHRTGRVAVEVAHHNRPSGITTSIATGGRVNITTTLATDINREHAAALAAANNAMQHAMEAGKLLAQAKQEIGHGGWLQWLQGNFDGSARMAQRYILLHEHRNEIATANTTRASHLTIRQASKLLSPMANQARDINVPKDSAYRLIKSAQTISALPDSFPLSPIGDVSVKTVDVIAESHLRAIPQPTKSASSHSPATVAPETFIPPDGEEMWILGEGRSFAAVVPSVHSGFYFVGWTEEDDFGNSTACGCKRAIAAAYIVKMLPDCFKVPSFYTDNAPDGFGAFTRKIEAPWEYNQLLYRSHQEYTDHAVLGVK